MDRYLVIGRLQSFIYARFVIIFIFLLDLELTSSVILV